MKSVGHATRFMYVINIFFRDLLQGLLLIYKEFKRIKILFPLKSSENSSFLTISGE